MTNNVAIRLKIISDQIAHLEHLIRADPVNAAPLIKEFIHTDIRRLLAAIRSNL